MTVYARSTAGGDTVERVHPAEGSHLDRHYADLASREVGGWRAEDAPAVAPATPPAPAVEADSPTPDQPAEPADVEPQVRRGRGRAAVKVNDPAPEG